MGSQAVYLGGIGACTPIGRNAWASAAAVRAGISGFANHPFMLDTAGEPMRVASSPWLAADFNGTPRFAALLIPAIEEALSFLPDRMKTELRLVLALALPHSRPGLPQQLDNQLRADIADKFPHRFAGVASFAIGHAAGLVGIHAAYDRLGRQEFDACLVAGVESYLEPETLEWLESNEQLHGAGPLNNAWGFVPGEAAGAVLLLNSSTIERLGIKPLALVLSVGYGFEPNRIKTDSVCVGDGLTRAFRGALAGLPPRALVSDVYCDMNGEPYRADECGFACVRTREAFVSAADFVAPADCWGDVSAATAPLAVVLASIASLKGYSNGQFAFVWASSEGGERGAALLETPLPRK